MLNLTLTTTMAISMHIGAMHTSNHRTHWHGPLADISVPTSVIQRANELTIESEQEILDIEYGVIDPMGAIACRSGSNAGIAMAFEDENNTYHAWVYQPNGVHTKTPLQSALAARPTSFIGANGTCQFAFLEQTGTIVLIGEPGSQTHIQRFAHEAIAPVIAPEELGSGRLFEASQQQFIVGLDGAQLVSVSIADPTSVQVQLHDSIDSKPAPRGSYSSVDGSFWLLSNAGSLYALSRDGTDLVEVTKGNTAVRYGPLAIDSSAKTGKSTLRWIDQRGSLWGYDGDTLDHHQIGAKATSTPLLYFPTNDTVGEHFVSLGARGQIFSISQVGSKFKATRFAWGPSSDGIVFAKTQGADPTPILEIPIVGQRSWKTKATIAMQTLDDDKELDKQHDLFVHGTVLGSGEQVAANTLTVPSNQLTMPTIPSTDTNDTQFQWLDEENFDSTSNDKSPHADSKPTSQGCSGCSSQENALPIWLLTLLMIPYRFRRTLSNEC